MEIIPKEIVENPFKLLPGYGKQIGQVQVHGYHDAASIVEGKVDETNKASFVPSSHSDAVTVFLNEDGRRIGAKRYARLYPAAELITEMIHEAGGQNLSPEEMEPPETTLSVYREGNVQCYDVSGDPAELIMGTDFKSIPGEVHMEFRREAQTIYYEKGKVISEEKYLENQSPAVMLMSNHNDGESHCVGDDDSIELRGQISNLSPVTEQTVSGDRINSIPNRIVWTAKKGG